MGNTSITAPSSRFKAVHPHTHGEHAQQLSLVLEKDGSSPHTWGTRQCLVPRLHFAGFIPTHMGNTGFLIPSVPIRAVHPHTHGEHQTMLQQSPAASGSSPHTWGTQQCTGWHQARHRFIPTHMGNTPLESFSACFKPVHPHTHGEHARRSSCQAASCGSSPHTWGTHIPN